VTEVHHGWGVYRGPGGWRWRWRAGTGTESCWLGVPWDWWLRCAMGPRGVPWPSRGVPWPLYEDHMLEPAIMIYLQTSDEYPISHW